MTEGHDIIIERGPESAVGYDVSSGRLFLLLNPDAATGEWGSRRYVDSIAEAALLHDPFVITGVTPDYVSELYPDLDSSTCRSIAVDASCNLAVSEAYDEVCRDQIEAEVGLHYESLGRQLMDRLGCRDLATLAHAIEGRFGLPSIEDAGIMVSRDDVLARVRRAIEESGDADDELLRAAGNVGPNRLALLDRERIYYIWEVRELFHAFGFDQKAIRSVLDSLASPTPAEVARRAEDAAIRRGKTGQENASLGPGDDRNEAFRHGL